MIHRTKIKARHARRAKARGAAMVEAVIVMSVMLMFMGLIVWTRNSYAMKMDLQQETRSSSLYYASHACTGDKNAASSERTGTVQDSSPEAETAAKKTNLAGAIAVASRAYNTARTVASGTSSFQAIWDAAGGVNVRRQGLSRKVESSSKVTCNEPRFDGGFKDWIQFGISYLGGGLGAAGSLFK
jgi:Flp pilus assembly protein TadG